MLQDWIGRQHVERDIAGRQLLERLAASLDLPSATLGEHVPQGWHCAYFPPLTLQNQLGEDGHPRKGEFLPPVPYPRRMFAGRSTRFHAQIPIDAPIQRISTISRIELKQGRQGPLVIVDVEHSVTVDGKLALTEMHNIFYLPAPAEGETRTAPPNIAPQLPTADMSDAFQATPTLLFRFSAVSFNAHRIHYDMSYAHREGHPDLVVNGGLIALKLMELAKRAETDRPLASFSARHVSPLYCGARVKLRARREGKAVRLWAVGEDGRIAAQGDAEFEA